MVGWFNFQLKPYECMGKEIFELRYALKNLIFIARDFLPIMKIGKGYPETFTYTLGVERVWK